MPVTNTATAKLHLFRSVWKWRLLPPVGACLFRRDRSLQRVSPQILL